MSARLRLATAGGVLRRWQRSIKGRLVLLFLLLALATSAVFLIGTQRLLAGTWRAYARPLVVDYADRLAAELGSPPSIERARALAARLPLVVRIDGPAVNFDSHPGALRRHFGPDDGPGPARDWGLTRSTADGHRIRFALAAPDIDSARPRGVGWITLGILLALTALAYATVRRLLRPLNDIGQGVAAFGAGRFEQPIVVRRDDELGELATRINAMAASLHGMLDAKRALLLAISHELRSPLTRARLNAELLDEGAERSALLRDLGEMRDLVTQLLDSERLAQGHAALHCEAVDLAALLREAAAAPADGAPAPGLDLDAAVAGPQWADATRLRLLLRNLLDNARRHAADATAPPRLLLRREADGRLALGVRDFGPGVPPEQIARLAEAFYRPDAARSRDAGGVGLGLHLCRLVAQAHGGELRIRNAGPGLEVAMVWRAEHTG